MASSDFSLSCFLSNAFYEIIGSPLNIGLVSLIAFLVYKIFKNKTNELNVLPVEPHLPKLKRRDFTIEELKQFDGTQESGRVLIAVLGNVYDVTRGKRFYGPGGPYAAFAGRDASRGLATFSVTCKTDEYDDLSDLGAMEMDSVKEWEAQFREKYDFVGRLLKPGEEPRSYSDEEDDEETGGEGGGEKVKSQ
ncbi:membrane-associated progesterone receptor component 1 [Agrilus planipennis]|uniref:Membrane-associated progesterone receptor component 1 n=1 Tax=Agrilus planipennis TaxID=224129 RepID=A0A7F5R6W0_AGRPL|nr:membrane-associated progesterone receptor component 1 [Agrilus planipennis]